MAWDFTDNDATLTIRQADPEHHYWFLYEGPVAGQWSPQTHFFGTSTGGPRFEQPDGKSQLFESWQWAYFGDRGSSRVLLVMQQQPDDLADTLWYLGSQQAGLKSDDGMLVFGFGRGPGTKPLFHGPGQQFRIGFVEQVTIDQPQQLHKQVTDTATHWKHSFPGETDQ